ncbi:MAG TPA: DUF1656 domain-containing protein [Caulobacteraceae bacterium]|jgi:hypothetical protein|nr:DUF1656 domain-containing protein [Caulobacteraceae bacterium]
MRAELDINGVFVSALLVFAVAAWLLTAIATRILAWAGFYRLVWHRALFDLALFVAVWGAVAGLAGAAHFGRYHP